MRYRFYVCFVFPEHSTMYNTSLGVNYHQTFYSFILPAGSIKYNISYTYMQGG